MRMPSVATIRDHIGYCFDPYSPNVEIFDPDRAAGWRGSRCRCSPEELLRSGSDTAAPYVRTHPISGRKVNQGPRLLGAARRAEVAK